MEYDPPFVLSIVSLTISIIMSGFVVKYRSAILKNIALQSKIQATNIELKMYLELRTKFYSIPGIHSIISNIDQNYLSKPLDQRNGLIEIISSKIEFENKFAEEYYSCSFLMGMILQRILDNTIENKPYWFPYIQMFYQINKIVKIKFKIIDNNFNDAMPEMTKYVEKIGVEKIERGTNTPKSSNYVF